MTELVTLDAAKDYLRVTEPDEDALIQSLVLAASEAVREVADKWDGTGDIPERLRLATLMLIADWFDMREASNPAFMAATMPNGVRWLVEPFRRLEV